MQMRLLVWWSTSHSDGRGKRENASGGLGSLLGGGQGRLHSKGGTAAKSSNFEEVVQGWPLKPCSSFSVAPGSRSQMPCAFFSFSSTSFDWSTFYLCGRLIVGSWIAHLIPGVPLVFYGTKKPSGDVSNQTISELIVQFYD